MLLFALLMGSAEKQHGRNEPKQLHKGEAHAYYAHDVKPLHDPHVKLLVAAALVQQVRVSSSMASSTIGELFQAT